MTAQDKAEGPNAHPDLGGRGWENGTRVSLDRWRQGHVLDDVPLVFTGVRGESLWNVGGEDLAALPMDLVLRGEPGQALRRAMLLTQACDLMKESFPWATVAPVYDATDLLDGSRAASARAGTTGHLVVLSAAWVADRLWVADLRLEMPVEKTLLLARHPRAAFAEEVRYPQLSEKLARQRDRAAVPDPCLEHIVAPLFDHIRARLDVGSDLQSNVRELRVQCDDPVAPAAVTLFVVQEENAYGEALTVDSAGWGEIVGAIYESALTSGITLNGPEFTTLWDMSARDYLTSSSIVDRKSS